MPNFADLIPRMASNGRFPSSVPLSISCVTVVSSGGSGLSCRDRTGVESDVVAVLAGVVGIVAFPVRSLRRS